MVQREFPPVSVVPNNPTNIMTIEPPPKYECKSQGINVQSALQSPRLQLSHIHPYWHRIDGTQQTESKKDICTTLQQRMDSGIIPTTLQVMGTMVEGHTNHQNIGHVFCKHEYITHPTVASADVSIAAASNLANVSKNNN